MALNDPHPVFGVQPVQPGSIGTTGTARHRDSDTERVAGVEVLPCGRSLGLVWEQTRAGAGHPDTRHANCPYCCEAIDGLTALARATCALRAEALPDSHRLSNRIIKAIRAEVRLGGLLVLSDLDHDLDHDLRVAESAAARVLRQAADTVPGTRAGSCRLSPSAHGHHAHTVAVTVAAGLDKPLRERAEAVRRAVLHAAEHLLGLVVTTVDVNIAAVLEAPRMPGNARTELRGPCRHPPRSRRARDG
ncbi:Asp23/Gls24 family envelope stress response protein [Streptomyces vinaceus]|uniref:hypothetical protein n=1 Tax=Streptomyces vinaceus TaxID=1960 RepID=UPI0037F91A4F